jgi:protein-disulfide isomerase
MIRLMKRLGFLLLSTMALGSLIGCQRDDTAVKEKLDQIDQRLAGIEQSLKSGAGAARGAAQPQRPQRPRPNPADVYAIPIGDSPIEGPPTAKITIVEAFEFA